MDKQPADLGDEKRIFPPGSHGVVGNTMEFMKTSLRKRGKSVRNGPARSENELAQAAHRAPAILVVAATRIAGGVRQGGCFARWMRQTIFRPDQDV
jgi:hypothetical protein